MDVLADVLRVTRLSGKVFCRTELTAPFGVAFPAGENMAAFHVIDRGRCWLRLDGQRAAVPLSSGEVVVINRCIGHQLLDTPTRRSLPFPGLLARTGETSVVRHGGGGPATTMVCGLFFSQSGGAQALFSLLPPLLHVKSGRRLGPTLKSLAAEVGSQKPGSQALVCRLSDVLFIQVLRAWIEEQPEGAGGWLGALRDGQLARALGHLHQEPASDWTVQRLARLVGMSRSVFAARFKALVGLAPLEYLTRWRMQLAANQLVETNLSLAEVSAQAGYRSAVAFNRAFKRAVGHAPGGYRRQRSVSAPA